MLDTIKQWFVKRKIVSVESWDGSASNYSTPKAYADAISWLLRHPREAKAMGRLGQERVRSHFSAERMAAETLSLYHTLLARRG